MVLVSRILSVFLFLFCPPILEADWTDDWFDQVVSSGSGTFKAQQRGFYSAGSFMARRQMTSDYLVSASPPRVSIGCGGIDLFGGAFTFLDAEYLVAKLQRVLQAAPAMAFQIAMQEYCKPCVSGMEALESITNQINQLQMNDCQSARGLATALVHPNQVGDQIRGMLSQGRSLTEGLRKNVQAYADDVKKKKGNPPDSTEELLEDCPDEFRNVFGGGSVLANITGRVGMEDYVDEMRGLVGDAIVLYNDSINQYQVTIYSYCLENDDMDPLNFIEGKIYTMNSSGVCSLNNINSIEARIEDHMDGIATKLVLNNDKDLAPAEVAFIDAAPFPVLNVLRDGVATGTVDSRKGVMSRPLAAAYAYRVFDDLLRVIRFATAKSNEVYENASSAGPDTDPNAVQDPDRSPDHCKPTIVAKALRYFQNLEPRLRDYRGRAQGQYAARVSEVNAAIAFSQSQLEIKRRQLSLKADVSGPE